MSNNRSNFSRTIFPPGKNRIIEKHFLDVRIRREMTIPLLHECCKGEPALLQKFCFIYTIQSSIQFNRKSAKPSGREKAILHFRKIITGGWSHTMGNVAYILPFRRFEPT